jgi:hypothetical protein
MEILSINFAIFVVQLAFCIVPIALGVRLFALSSDVKVETRKKISKKLLRDSSLIKQSFYNFVLYFMASIFILFGLLVALILLISSY